MQSRRRATDSEVLPLETLRVTEGLVFCGSVSLATQLHLYRVHGHNGDPVRRASSESNVVYFHVERAVPEARLVGEG